MPETTRTGLANGVAGMFSSLISSLYFVPLEVIGDLILFILQFLELLVLTTKLEKLSSLDIK